MREEVHHIAEHLKEKDKELRLHAIKVKNMKRTMRHGGAMVEAKVAVQVVVQAVGFLG